MGSESETDPTNGVLNRVVLAQETERATARSTFLESVENEEAQRPPRSASRRRRQPTIGRWPLVDDGRGMPGGARSVWTESSTI